MSSRKQELHLWLLDLDRPDRLSRDFGTLSAEERKHAAALVFDRDRHRYVRTHGALRAVLGRYLNTAPETVCLRSTAEGKPYLHTCSGNQTIRFSLSHSEGSAIIAVACDRPVGVDLERLRSVPDALSIASQFFGADEVEVLRGSPTGSLDGAFLRMWTMKEAFAKCLGMGLSLPLDSFSVLELSAEEYIMRSLQIPGGFVGAVVYPAPALVHRSFGDDGTELGPEIECSVAVTKTK